LIGEAIGAVHALGSGIRIGMHPSDGTWNFELQKVGVAKEYLEIAAGDLEAGESGLIAGVEGAVDLSLELARTAVEFTPIIGSIIMVGEAISGTSITGQQLSTAERALLGAGALLAEVGTIIRAGQITVAATRLSTVAEISMADSLRLCMVSRALTTTERASLAALAAKVRDGAVLTDKEMIVVNRLMGKLSEADRALGVRARLLEETKTATQAGRFTNLDPASKASEIAIGQALAKNFGADVVKLAADAAKQGAKNPDFLINNAVAEFVELERAPPQSHQLRKRCRGSSTNTNGPGLLLSMSLHRLSARPNRWERWIVFGAIHSIWM
jgi:hypothetical protein